MLIVSIPWWLALVAFPLVAAYRITIAALFLTARGVVAITRHARRRRTGQS